jgi:hypothetical protein
VLKSFLLLLLLGISGTLSAQRWQVGGGVGANLFKGDLLEWFFRPSVNQLTQVSPSFHAQVRYQEKQAFAYRGILSIGQIKGDGSLRPMALTGFTTDKFSGPILELGGIVDYNFRDYQSNKKIPNWTPYLYAGLAGIFAAPDVISTAGPSGPQAMFGLGIPFGVGAKYQLNSQWGLQAEFGATKALSDRLDNNIGPPGTGGSGDFFTLGQTDQNLHLNLSVTYSIISIFCPKE